MLNFVTESFFIAFKKETLFCILMRKMINILNGFGKRDKYILTIFKAFEEIKSTPLQNVLCHEFLFQK